MVFATSNPCLLEILKDRVTLVSAYGRTTTDKLVGIIHLVLKDNEGKLWSYDIFDVVYDPESPYSLLGITFIGKYFARNDEANEFNEQTWLQSASTSSLSNGTMAHINDI
jgi:hypothetical protein